MQPTGNSKVSCLLSGVSPLKILLIRADHIGLIHMHNSSLWHSRSSEQRKYKKGTQITHIIQTPAAMLRGWTVMQLKRPAKAQAEVEKKEAREVKRHAQEMQLPAQLEEGGPKFKPSKIPQNTEEVCV